ncbi:hypothetical protein [Mycobacteroides abscessus]|uniref:hypothetical protein n=1 Tax=Mycobacteroides abscessus TaxID=36809 RepID=UPI00078E50EE|nr:hypothetical protein [Mycobacteroides abscessus]AMU78148.1 hypothetical protein A3O06_15150 [Mycobacteroides abscessus]ANO27098.1 hypothetical protein BAB79_15145 [Mycobacteroides abscessus]
MAGERELSEEPAGEIYIDEYYELRASNGLMQIVPSTFSVAPPVDDPESAVRQFIDDVHRMAAEMASCAGVSDPMVIIRRYDSPMDQLLAAGDDHASRQRFSVDAETTPPEDQQHRGSWLARIRRLHHPR